MSTRAYTILGWVIWQLGKRAARYEARHTRAKVGAAVTVLAVLAAGVVAAKLAASGDD
jgi:hypothetical protein